MKKRIAVTAVTLAALLAFSGCSPKAVTAGDSPKEPKPVASAPAAEPTVAAPPEKVADEGSREAPLPYGQEVTIYDTSTNEALWLITVNPTLDQTDAILAENQFTSPPTARYLALSVHAVWQGVEPITPWADFENGLDVSWVSTDGVTHEETFVVSPWPSLMDIADLYQGGAADFTTIVDADPAVGGLVRVTAGGYHFFVGDN